MGSCVWPSGTDFPQETKYQNADTADLGNAPWRQPPQSWIKLLLWSLESTLHMGSKMKGKPKVQSSSVTVVGCRDRGRPDHFPLGWSQMVAAKAGLYFSISLNCWAWKINFSISSASHFGLDSEVHICTYASKMALPLAELEGFLLMLPPILPCTLFVRALWPQPSNRTTVGLNGIVEKLCSRSFTLLLSLWIQLFTCTILDCVYSYMCCTENFHMSFSPWALRSFFNKYRSIIIWLQLGIFLQCQKTKGKHSVVPSSLAI